MDWRTRNLHTEISLCQLKSALKTPSSPLSTVWGPKCIPKDFLPVFYNQFPAAPLQNLSVVPTLTRCPCYCAGSWN